MNTFLPTLLLYQFIKACIFETNNYILWTNNFSPLSFKNSIEDRSECSKHASGNNLISPDTDYRAGSSFELSPSDSSDGTYMWDEEGLEPIGNVHPVGSYESSEMNSIVCMDLCTIWEHFVYFAVRETWDVWIFVSLWINSPRLRNGNSYFLRDYKISGLKYIMKHIFVSYKDWVNYGLIYIYDAVDL